MSLDRRRWLLKAAGIMGGAARAVEFEMPPDGAEKLIGPQTRGMILFRWNDRPLAAYRAHTSQKHPYSRQPSTLAKGKPIRTRYRVVLHAGTPKEGGLGRVYNEWMA